MSTIRIGGRTIGEHWPSYFVADIAANHDGSLERAVELIALAAESGADAAKFQNFRAETIVSDRGFRDLGSGLSHQSGWRDGVVATYEAAVLPVEWTTTLADACTTHGIDYFTAPYDLELLDQLRPHVCAWKVGSGDITWHEELDVLAQDGKPVLLATGASDQAEVDAAMAVLLARTSDVVLMQCNTNYTGDLENFRHIELNVLRTFAAAYPDVVLGLSDHTPGHATVLGAVALGARVFEKHFTDDRGRPGPDHPFSMEPGGWREMVECTRQLELALGTGEKRVMDNERDTVVVQRRAVRARRRLDPGTVVGADDLAVLRPCPPEGLPPYRIGEVLGRVVIRTVEGGGLVTPDDVARG